ncbi:beta-class phenol-soluble modulin [Staphylococcus xylosus]
MAGLFDAIKETVQASIAGDGAKLGTSIVSIVENGVALASKLFGF